MPKPYKYRRLRPDKQELRLITILPNPDPTQSLRLTIQHASLAKEPSYETISYVWGEPTRSACLVVTRDALLERDRARLLHVPINTEAALRRARLEDRPRTLWIDAVCINQSDLAERSSQVAIMGRIYAGSYGNLVYVGEVDRDTAVRIERTVQRLQVDAADRTREFRDFKEVLAQRRSAGGERDGLSCTVDLEALVFVLRLQWFRRLWVLQEATLAPTNTVLLGPEIQLDLLHVIRAVVWWDHCTYASVPREAVLGLQCLELAHTYIDHAHGAFAGRSRPLESLLAATQLFERHEARDGVFALLSMTEEPIRSGFIPDYMQPLRDILQKATRYAIIESQRTWLLTCVEHRPGDLENGTVASWAFRADRKQVFYEDQGVFDGVYAACGKWKTYQTAVAKDDESSGTLLVRGWEFDAVDSATSSYSYKAADSDGYAEWVVEALQVYSILPSKPCPQAAFMSSVARTLALGRLLPASRIPGNEAGMRYVDRLLRTLWLISDQMPLDIEDFMVAVSATLSGRYWRYHFHRRLFWTRGRRFGLGPQVMLSGDVVAVLQAAHMPCLLRPAGRGRYRFVGPAYVDGLMNGEAVAEGQARGEDSIMFALV